MAEEMILGSRYFFIPNLPDMKQIDFIKAIASILGVFAVPAADNSERIRFVSIDDVIGNIPIAVDWTTKVVASYKDNKPGEITFTLDGFAQRNHFRWKEDSDVTGSYDGVAGGKWKTLPWRRMRMLSLFRSLRLRCRQEWQRFLCIRTIMMRH